MVHDIWRNAFAYCMPEKYMQNHYAYLLRADGQH